MTLNKIRDMAYKNSADKGWWEDIRPGSVDVIPEKLMLIVTEVAEAMEAYRINDFDLYLDKTNGEKPEGMPAELADIIIRVADLAGHLGIDLDEAVRVKMQHNETRPYRHGGKRA